MTKKLHWNTEEPQFQKTHQKDKTRRALTIENQTMHKKKSKPNSVEFDSSFNSTGLAVKKQSG